MNKRNSRDFSHSYSAVREAATILPLVAPRPSSRLDLANLKLPPATAAPRPSSRLDLANLKLPPATAAPRPSSRLDLANLKLPPATAAPRPSSRLDLANLKLPPAKAAPRPLPKVELGKLKVAPVVDNPLPVPKLSLGTLSLISSQHTRIGELQRENSKLLSENVWLNKRLDEVESGQCEHRGNQRGAFGCYFC